MTTTYRDEDGGGLTPARHATPDGPDRGWSAADVHPDEYSDDDYAAQFPVVDQAEGDR